MCYLIIWTTEMTSKRLNAPIAVGSMVFTVLLILRIQIAHNDIDVFPSLSFPWAHAQYGKICFHEDAPIESKVGEASTITVVTAYYNVPSKRNKRDYIKMMKNFLPQIPCNLYIFTSKENQPILAKLRGSYIQRTKFIVKEFHELQEAQRMDVWELQHKIDPEGSYQSPQVYAVWNEKIHMVMEAIRDVFNSEFFIWCDIGSFRTPRFTKNLVGFPNPQKTKPILKDHNKMTMLLLEPYANSSFVMGAGIMAGHKDAWQIWNKVYYDTQKLMLRNGLLAGKEQNVLYNAVVRCPQSFNLVSPKPYFKGKGDQWFYFQYYFS